MDVGGGGGDKNVPIVAASYHGNEKHNTEGGAGCVVLPNHPSFTQ